MTSHKFFSLAFLVGLCGLYIRTSQATQDAQQFLQLLSSNPSREKGISYVKNSPSSSASSSSASSSLSSHQWAGEPSWTFADSDDSDRPDDAGVKDADLAFYDNDAKNYRHGDASPSAAYFNDGPLRRAVALLKSLSAHGDTAMEKRQRASRFYGSRGKRFMPGLGSLLLANYYRGQLANPEKWKRQPHLGFYASRG